jgi:hypothetical protein
MAAAARPGSSASGDARDARIPCPLCGGLIHPIAGKCKHCKADLTSYRSARPAASAPLPPLYHPAAAPASNGHAASAPVAHAVPLPPAALPVLPVRPTSRAAATDDAGGSAWRSWPVVVIAVAVLAIVAAVVLMMWPEHRGRDGKRTLAPPPAPERMDTQTPPATPRLDAPRAAPPAQPHAQVPPAADPPADPGAQADPAAGSGADPSADATDDDPAPDLFDPLGVPGARSRNHGAVIQSFGGLLGFAVTVRLCKKLIQCGTGDDVLKPMCDAMVSQPTPPLSGCPAAERCLRHIDAIGCTGALQMSMLLMRFRDCAEAARC